MQRLTVVLLTCLFCLLYAPGVQATPLNNAVFQPGSDKYIVNNQEQQMDTISFIEDGRVFVPIRYLAYACGVTDENILWDPASQTVQLLLADKQLTLQVGSNQLIRQEGMIEADATPQIIGARTYLPARWVAAYFGYTVDWDTANKAVLIYPSEQLKPRPPLPVKIILVNKQFRLPTDYRVGGDSLIHFKGYPFSSLLQEPLQNLFTAAAGQGVSLTITSGYRTAAEQQAIFNNRASQLGLKMTTSTVAPVGHSEHQTGLAVDIAGNGKAYAWLAANSWQHGFILRYPEGKETITGYSFEPWHFRYIGLPIAAFMHHKGIATLEEFIYYYAGS